MSKRPGISTKPHGKFKRYGRFCKTCDKYFHTYLRHSSICLDCKSVHQRLRYFKKFPSGNELNIVEKRIYNGLIKTQKYIIQELV